MNFLRHWYNDYRAIVERDPAIRGWGCLFQVIFLNTGFQAVFVYRIAHFLYRLRIPVIPKILVYVAKIWTGIDIHPAARIGTGFFIDHGMGTVIGETTEIGDNCTLFQGVTLGGTGKEQGKRHPTLGNKVVVGAGAKILGSIVIGDVVKIGANSVVLKNIPALCTVVGIPGRVAKQGSMPLDMAHGDLIDPMEELLSFMQKDMAKVQKTLSKMRKELAETERKLNECPIEYHI